jgi:ribonuclease Z
MAQDTRVVLLGTGTPNPEPDRSGPSVAIVSGDRVYVVDCGPGVVRRAAQAGINMKQLTRLFVTHLHTDHTVGLPDFIFTPAVTGRLTALEAYGPPGFRGMVSLVMKAWKEDIAIRFYGGEPAVTQAYEVQAHDVRPGEVYRDDVMRVKAIAVEHGKWKHSLAYRFEAKDKVIVVSGDTTMSDRLVAGAQGCDILVHEVYSHRGWEKRTADWRKYHASYHTSGPDVGRVAARVKPKTLVLYHQLPMGEKPEQVVGEVRSQFNGKVVYGKDLDVIR